MSSPWFEDLIQSILKISGVSVRSGQKVIGSRRTLERLMNKIATGVKSDTIKDIKNANDNNCVFTISFDDSHLQNGNRENIHAFNLTWFHNGRVHQRYLESQASDEKNNDALMNSCQGIIQDYNLNNYNVITDCASANVKAISKMTNNGDPVEHAICGAHSLNNAFKMGIEKCTD